MDAEIFGYTYTPGQLNIIGSVLDPQIKRLSVCAMTRYGKTQSVSTALLLTALQKTKKVKRIILASPTIDQTHILRNYIAEQISNSLILQDNIDMPSRGSAEHLKKEMSKKRLTFKTNWELLTLTAHGKGEQLMGFGGDLIVLDEACLISDEVYTSKISRMLGDNPDSKLVEMVNPWHRHNFAWRHWQNPNFKKIHIDYMQALREGRATETFIEEQRTELSEYEFNVLYDSVFAEESEDTLIRWGWIDYATKTPIMKHELRCPVWGLDVAEAGSDLTVLTKTYTDYIKYKQTETHVLKTVETMDTANAVSAIVPKEEMINVDSIGVGAGVYSRLKEQGHNVVSVRVSQSPLTKNNRYLNQKSQWYWRLRSIFESKQIEILNDKRLIRELSQMRYEFTSTGKIKIVDPEGKSPDFADSLMLCMVDKRVAKPIFKLI